MIILREFLSCFSPGHFTGIDPFDIIITSKAKTIL